MPDPDLLRRLLRAKDLMDTAWNEDWPVTRLARISGASEAHFARSFSEAFGLPPHRYLLTRRMERAQALLRDTELPVAEVALRVGYRSIGTFGRTFRDVTGMTPGQYREHVDDTPTGSMPLCYARAVARPDLRISVSEKRRRDAGAIDEQSTRECS